MKRYSLFGLIFVLFLGLLYNNLSAQATKNMDVNPLQYEELLLHAMETAGFKMEEFNINTSVYIPNIFLSMKELEEKQKILMKALNIEGETIVVDMDQYGSGRQNYFEDLSEVESETILIQKTEEEGYNQIILFVPNEDGYFTVLKLLSTQIVDYTETYIIVDIVNNKGYKEIVEISNQIEGILKEYGNEIQTTVNLTGACLGELTKTEEKQKQEIIFSLLEAKKIEVLEDEFYTSITAYTPLIESFINYGQKKVNLQLAMRYNEYENKTYLWVANPLITTTY